MDRIANIGESQTRMLRRCADMSCAIDGMRVRIIRLQVERDLLLVAVEDINRQLAAAEWALG